MKTLRTRIAAILLVAAMGITMSACSDDSDVTSASGGAEVSDNGDTSGGDSDSSSAETNNDNNSNNNNENNNSETSAADPESSVEEATDDPLVQEVTFDWGNNTESVEQDPTEAPTESDPVIVTEYVTVTEAGGQAATDDAGSVVTEVVTQTQAATSAPYIPSMDKFRSYWLDMKKKNGAYNKVFNGEFLVVTFKIKEGTPDGNYPISLTEQDFVNWEEEQLDVKTVDGHVTVGSAIQIPNGQAQPGQFTIQAMNAKGNVGDEVEVVFNVTDNPGLVGYIFNFQYDENAMEIVNARVGNDCIDVIGTVND